MKTNCETPYAPGGIVRPLRTLLVDDSFMFLACLRELLATQKMFNVLGTAANGNEALEKAAEFTPDLVLMDLNMPYMDGLEATAELRRRLPDTRIVIMTLNETAEARVAARAHGAHGFLAKNRIIADLTTEIDRVFRLKRTSNERRTAPNNR